MGSIIIDKTGRADLSFHNIPLYAVKKATIKRPSISAAFDLFKIIVNGVTYNFAETAQNGAVIFGKNYGGWEFIAPDGRFNFESYRDMTVGEVLDDMEAVLADNPIPAWDAFVAWLNSLLGDNGLPLGDISRTVLVSDCGSDAYGHFEVDIDLPSFSGAADCVSFLEQLETYFEPALNEPAVTCIGSYTDRFSFLIHVYAQDNATEVPDLTMAFTFRE